MSTAPNTVKKIQPVRNPNLVTYLLGLIFAISLITASCSTSADTPEAGTNDTDTAQSGQTDPPASADSTTQVPSEEPAEDQNGQQEPAGQTPQLVTIELDSVEMELGPEGKAVASVDDGTGNIFSIHGYSTKPQSGQSATAQDVLSFDLGACLNPESQTQDTFTISVTNSAGGVLGTADVEQQLAEEIWVQTVSFGNEHCTRGWAKVDVEGTDPKYVVLQDPSGTSVGIWELAELSTRSLATIDEMAELVEVAEFGQVATVESGPYEGTQIEVHGWAELGLEHAADSSTQQSNATETRDLGVEIEWCNLEGAELAATKPKVGLVAYGWPIEARNVDVLEQLVSTTPGSCSRFWLEFEVAKTVLPDAIYVQILPAGDGSQSASVLFSLDGGAVNPPTN